jgi:RsiW-degrading membrane proteinase PrsW (M82 family)
MNYLLFILAVAPGLFISYVIFRIDKYEREPFHALLLCFVLGALVTLPSLAIERWGFRLLLPWRDTAGGTAVLAFIALALNEELCKFAVLLVAAFPYRFFNEPLDGIVYAVLVAMGFVTLENAVYVRNFGMGTALLRAFTAVPAHLVFAIVQGYYIGLAKFGVPTRRRKLLWRAVLWATLLHGIYDFLILQRWSEWLIVLATFSLYLSLFYCARFVQHHQENSPFRRSE